MLFTKREGKSLTDVIKVSEELGFNEEVLSKSIELLVEKFEELEESFGEGETIHDSETNEFIFTNFTFGYSELLILLEFIGIKLSLRCKSKLYKLWKEIDWEIELENFNIAKEVK